MIGVHTTISPIELSLIIKTLDLLDSETDITQINGNYLNSNFEYLTLVKSVTIKVIGKVQGVWFRASTKAKAEELNLNGEVKNMEDGSVFVKVEGNRKTIQQFIKWCQVGPEMAKVKETIVSDSEIKNYTDFKIIRR